MLETVSAADVADTSDWVEDFTADHSGAVGPLVDTLWPLYADESDGWREALEERLKRRCQHITEKRRT